MDWSRLFATLSPEEHDRLETLLLEEGSQFGVFPLSFTQEHKWFDDRLKPGTSMYNVTVALRLEGRLQVAALEQSLGEIVARHEALRTTFHLIGKQPVQAIAPPSARPVALPVLDIQALHQADQHRQVQRLAMEERGRPFDLEQGPLWRAILLRLDEEAFILLFTIHHVVFDDWSIRIFVRELVALYEAYSEGGSSPLPELPIQYADFAVWQRRWLDEARMDAELAFWKRRLAEVPPLLDLPTDYPRPPVQSFRAATHPLVLSETLTASLRHLCRQEGVTLFMTLLATLQTLLYRYTGQCRIAVSANTANRNRPEIKGVIGDFTNLLVLAAKFTGEGLSFRDRLRQTRESVLEAQIHADLPAQKLVETHRPKRDNSHAPLSQVLFTLLSKDNPDSLTLPELRVSRIEVMDRMISTPFDLELCLWEGLKDISGYLVYSTNLFHPETIANMAEHFQTLLEGAAMHPDRRLSDLPLPTDRERCQMLLERHSALTERPDGRGLHHRFEEQAKKTPEAIAILSREEQVTYGQLDRRANQLARALRAQGVGPERVVVIRAGRSIEMVVGLLAVLKAGGACLLLEPDDAGPAPETAEKALQLSVQLDQHALNVDSFGYEREAYGPDRGEVVTGNQLASVIYQAAPVGSPRTILVEHQQLASLLDTCIQACDVQPGSRCLQIAPVSTGMALVELLMPLLAGATLCLAPPGDPISGPALLRLLRELSVTVVVLPSSVLLTLPVEQLPALRAVIATGELRPAEVLLHGATHCRVFYAFGSFELALWLAAAGTHREGLGATGRPADGVQAYVLDANGHPAPTGVRGELCVGGAGLPRGYAGRAGQTAERFVPHPFGREHGGRLYKTGQLARSLPNGDIEFLGYLEEQATIHGYRVRPAEIEQVLYECPAVREAAVVVRGRTLGEKRLVAYVVLREGAERSRAVRELHGFLSRRLPRYMRPAALTILEGLPLTPGGRIDRSALPAPDEADRLHDRMAQTLAEGAMGTRRDQLSATKRALLEKQLRRSLPRTSGN